MEQVQRLNKIIEFLQEKETLELHELITHFNISKDTARRDILKLTEQGLATRIRGGIASPKMKEQVQKYADRIISNSNAKQKIAQMASDLAKDKEVIWLDVSTTVQFMPEYISSEDNLFVTNSINNIVAFAEQGHETYLLGGYFSKHSQILSGISTLSQLDDFSFDIAFIGASGIGVNGIYYDEFNDLSLKRSIIKNSKKVYVLADESKFNIETNYKIPFDGITGIITEEEISYDIEKALSK
ncbi:DeoR/GlpR family DNA-binding transcription regulator [Lactococcus lactis]|nr:DeoR/GlpR family DNA-binding transcription regulator [Lactococcus lactis]